MHYSNFRVEPPTDNYQLSLSGITPDDPYTVYSISGHQFTTYDRYNDIWGDNCTLNGHGSESGGWWHTNHNNLNYNYTSEGSVSISTCNWLFLNYRQQDFEIQIHDMHRKNKKHVSLPINTATTFTLRLFFLLRQQVTSVYRC